MLIVLIVVCVVFGLLLFAVFSGLLFGDEYDGFGVNGPPRLKELSPGCLLSLIVAGSIWFIAWGIVLLLAIRLLRTPLGE